MKLSSLEIILCLLLGKEGPDYASLAMGLKRNDTFNKVWKKNQSQDSWNL